MVTITKYGNQLTKDFMIEPAGIVTGRFEEEGGTRDESDLFPSLADEARARLDDDEADDYEPNAHAPSNVASSMMYLWQGPLPEGEDEAGFQRAIARDGAFVALFDKLFGGASAKAYPPVPTNAANLQRKASVKAGGATALGGYTSTVDLSDPMSGSEVEHQPRSDIRRASLPSSARGGAQQRKGSTIAEAMHI
mmetsp:Transcript_12131/g.36159  ORF Transcript_12131/g.36159 Transcript_12131/m.36159 type:complete len:194 (-) Transcript_12131:597-1178(-)